MLQRHCDDWRLVQCWSHFLVIAESRYAVVDLELTVVLWAYRNCHVYLAGLPHFVVVVDHRPLVTILNHKQLNAVDSPPPSTADAREVVVQLLQSPSAGRMVQRTSFLTPSLGHLPMILSLKTS